MSRRLHASYSSSILASYHDRTPLRPSNLILPIFVMESNREGPVTEEIPALPGVNRWQVGPQLVEYLQSLIEKGLTAILLFGVIRQREHKDEIGSYATDPSQPVAQALRLLSSNFSSDQLLLIADVCLCAYTDHGHCGILNDDQSLNNTASCSRIAQVSQFYVENGAQCIAPSDMMDDRIASIYQAMTKNQQGMIPILSYSAKFASSFYGPFREACGSQKKQGIDRSKYQLPSKASNLAVEAAHRDLDQGASMVMVKPAGAYLDILQRLRQDDRISRVPIVAYQVSGEYSMLVHAANNNCIDYKQGVMESLESIRRAGADLVITYFVPQLLEWLQ